MDTLALAFSMNIFPLMAILKKFLVHRACNLLTTDVPLNQIFPSGFGKPMDGWLKLVVLVSIFFKQIIALIFK